MFRRLWYNIAMSEKPLIETNPYLSDPEQRRELIYTAVATSTAIETGYIVTARSDYLAQMPEKIAESEEPYRSGR